MELVQPLEAPREEPQPFAVPLPQPSERDDSPLGRARIQRQLTRAEAARRAGITEEEAGWLEEGRVYRFPSADDALLAALLYGTALGIDNREARALAGLPVSLLPSHRRSIPRLLVIAAIAASAAALVTLLLLPHTRLVHPSHAARGPSLPAPWKIPVTVLNGSGDINYTRQVAGHVQAFGYTIRRVGRAPSFGYQQTAVYFPPRCEAVAQRLGEQLRVPTKALPGGSGPCKLWVIAGPARGPGN
jgi:transcriptional regulator with XRE-family HTH domain